MSQTPKFICRQPHRLDTPDSHHIAVSGSTQNTTERTQQTETAIQLISSRRVRSDLLRSREISSANRLLRIVRGSVPETSSARARRSKHGSSDSDGAHLTPSSGPWRRVGARRSRFLVFAFRFVGLPAVPQNFRNCKPTAEHFLLPTSAHARHSQVLTNEKETW